LSREASGPERSFRVRRWRQKLDYLAQRLRRGRDFADERVRQFHDEKQFGGYKHTEGRDIVECIAGPSTP